MYCLNRSLEAKILEADGRYLDLSGLQPLEQYVKNYAVRLETYQNLRDHSPALVLKALKQLAQNDPELVQKYGQRCQYDMTEVLRYLALSILRDDEVFFTEQMMSWLDTIIMAHKRTAQCSNAYRYLQAAIAAQFSPSSSSLIRPYLDRVIQSLQSHA